MLIGPCVSISAAAYRSLGSLMLGGFHFYLDPTKSDANDGRSPGSAVATPAALAALVGSASYRRLGILRDAELRAMLQIGTAASPVHGTMVGAYGPSDGARPMLRADDVLSAGGWTKTVGQTNVYERQEVIAQRSGKSAHISVFQDDAVMRLVSSVANCDSIAGSYYLTSHTSTGAVTLYIHPTGDGDPASNGKVYEITKRLAGLVLYGDDCRASDIFTRRNHDDDGSLNIYGLRATIKDCSIWEGTKHNTIAGGGALWDGCDIRHAYTSSLTTSTGNMVVIYEDVGSGLGYTVKDTDFYREAYPAAFAITGIYSHAGSGSLGPQLVQDVTFEGPFDTCVGGDNINDSLIQRVVADGAIRFTDVSVPQRVVEDSQHVSAATNCNFVNNDTNHDGPLILRRNKVCLTNAQDALVRCLGTVAVDVVLEDNLFYAGSANTRQVYQRKGTLALSGNTFGKVAAGSISNINAGTSGDTVAVTSDYNHWLTPTDSFINNGTTYAGLAAWQATGQDTHSDSVGSAAAACTLPA